MKLRSERRKRIVELRQQGKTIAEIRTILGMAKNNLSATLAHMRKQGSLPAIPQQEAVRRQKEAVKKRGCNPELILNLHRQGLSQDAIADQLKQRKGYVSRILRNVQKQETETFRIKLIALYQSGMTYKDMATQLNVTIGCCGVTVNRLVKQGKLKLRGHSKPPKIARHETTEGFVVLPIPKKPTRTYRVSYQHKPDKSLCRRLNKLAQLKAELENKNAPA